MKVNVSKGEIEDLFDFNAIEKIDVRCAAAQTAPAGEDAFEELEVRMVMRIWNMSRAEARRHMARRRKEAEGQRKRRQAEAERMRPPDFMPF